MCVRKGGRQYSFKTRSNIKRHAVLNDNNKTQHEQEKSQEYILKFNNSTDILYVWSSSSEPSFSLHPYPVPSPEQTQINRIIIDKGWICLFPPLPLAVAQYGQEGGSAQDQIISTPNVIITCSMYLVMLNLMMINIVSFWPWMMRIFYWICW